MSLPSSTPPCDDNPPTSNDYIGTVYDGHQDTVLDIETRNTDCNIVATSSEDKSIRIWDIRTKRSVQCIVGFDECPAERIKFSPSKEHELIGMTDKSVFKFDLRSESIIIRDSQVIYTSSSECDLSSISFHPKDSVVAVGDDNGVISLVNIDTGDVIRRLSRVHSSVIGAAEFSPFNPKVLVSGGFDSLCCSWDVLRGRPASEVVDFTHQQQGNQISNPPFVHDIMHLPGGRVAVCALGDGTGWLLRSTAGGLQPVCTPVEMHGGMVTALSPWHSSFLSCGADRCVKGWIVTENSVGSGGRAVGGSGSRKKKGGRKKQETDGGTNIAFSVNLAFSLDHGEKINTISSWRNVVQSDTELGDSLRPMPFVVADVTQRWHLYTPVG